MISDKTLYSYVNNSLFTARNIDMPRTVRMSPRKNKSKTLKIDKSYRILCEHIIQPYNLLHS